MGWFQPLRRSASSGVNAAPSLALRVFAQSPARVCRPCHSRPGRDWPQIRFYLDLGLHCLTHEDGRPACFASVSLCPNEKRLNLLSALDCLWNESILEKNEAQTGCSRYTKQMPTPAVITVRGDSSEPLSQKRLYHEVSFKDEHLYRISSDWSSIVFISSGSDWRRFLCLCCH